MDAGDAWDKDSTLNAEIAEDAGDKEKAKKIAKMNADKRR
jgi:hypothetical protein